MSLFPWPSYLDVCSRILFSLSLSFFFYLNTYSSTHEIFLSLASYSRREAEGLVDSSICTKMLKDVPSSLFPRTRIKELSETRLPELDSLACLKNTLDPSRSLCELPNALFDTASSFYNPREIVEASDCVGGSLRDCAFSYAWMLWSIRGLVYRVAWLKGACLRSLQLPSI